jgi:tetratricopeptide (TPR) repeat protein
MRSDGGASGHPAVGAPRWWLVPLLLALLTVGAHAWDLNGEFAYDDSMYIVNNPAVQAGIGHWTRFFTDGSTYGSMKTSHYRPLVALSYAANVSMGLGTFGFKATQVGLHLLTVLSLYWLVGLIGRRPEEGGAGLDLPRGTAFVTAAWVAVAPFDVDAVHYLTARSSVLCGLFCVLAVGAFIRMRRARGGAVWGWYAAHLAALGLAAVSKETGLALPAVALAADLILLRPKGGRRPVTDWWPYAPYLAGGVLAWALMPNVHRVFSYISQVFGEEWRLAAAIRCLVENVRLMLLPTGLSITHSLGPGLRLADPGTIVSALLVALAAAGAWGLRRRATLVTFGLAWYFLLISPSTFVHLREVLQEHRGYAASMGVGMAVGWGVAALWAVAGRRRTVVAAGLGVALVLLLVATQQRQLDWKSDETLWGQALKLNPTSPRPYAGLGVYYARNGDFKRAEPLLVQSVRMDPSETQVVLDLARLYQDTGQLDKAEKAFLFARRMVPRDPVTFARTLRFYEDTKQLAKIVPMYREALERWPDHAGETHLALGNLYRRMGDPEAAEAELRVALKALPGMARVPAELARLASDGGRPAEAAAWLEKAVRLAPGAAGYWFDLGEALDGAGQADDARLAYRRFLQLATGPDPEGRRETARDRLARMAGGEGGTP